MEILKHRPLKQRYIVKLSELKEFEELRLNDTKENTNEQGFAQYSVPLTGIEVEVENLTDRVITINNQIWTATDDGSLRNHGREFITRPSSPKQVETAINNLFDNLPKDVHFSPRTSIHVHLNCRELTLKQIYNIVILYQCFEDLLYDFAGKERKKSIFCVPIGNTQYYNGFKSVCFQGDVYRYWSKYTGLNVKPINEYGTIEFRHLRGTKDKSTIFTWLHLLYRLYTYATNSETETLENLIQTISKEGDYSRLGRLVFNEMFTVLQSVSWEKKMQEDLAISKLFINNNTRNIMEGRF